MIWQRKTWGFQCDFECINERSVHIQCSIHSDGMNILWHKSNGLLTQIDIQSSYIEQLNEFDSVYWRIVVRWKWLFIKKASYIHRVGVKCILFIFQWNTLNFTYKNIFNQEPKPFRELWCMRACMHVKPKIKLTDSLRK